jgi:YfiH family protein
MEMQRRGRIHYLAPTFETKNPTSIQGFTTRHEGVSRPPYNSLNLGTNTDDTPHAVEGNRSLLARTFGITLDELLTVRQVHGSDVLVIDEPNQVIAHLTTLEADAIITNQPNLMIGVAVADCVPILVHDTKQHVVAAIHAGWKGTALNICGKVIEGMQSIFNSTPDDLRVAIGPCIGPCCYQVDRSVATAFTDQAPIWQESAIAQDKEHWQLDLAKANFHQLRACGIPESHIDRAGICVSCQKELFFSHRRDDGVTGRHLGFIMLTNR